MILLYIAVIFVGIDAMLNPYGPTVINDYTNCIDKIIDENFVEAGLLYFVNTKNMSTVVARIRADLLKVIHKDMKYLVQIASPTEVDEPMCNGDNIVEQLRTTDLFGVIPVANFVVVIVDTYEEFTRVASRLIRARSWNPRALFIILLIHLSNSDKNNVTYVENIVECLFRWNVVNIIVIVPQASNIRNANVYSWKPYDPPKYCGYLNETAKGRIFKETTCERGVLMGPKKVFYNKIPRDMKGCLLEIIALQRQPFVSDDSSDPNIERKLIDEVASEFNFRTNYTLLDKMRGEKLAGEWKGAVQDLILKKGNILLGGVFPDDDIHKDFDCSSTYLADSYTWIVPRAFQSPPWVALVVIFHKFVWCSTIFGYILCAISWRIFGGLSGDSLYHTSIDHCLLNVLVSNLGFAAYARPVTKTLRIFFIFFSLYCILFVTAYQTKLIDVLTNPPFEYQIKTIEELIQSGLQLGGFEELQDLFYNSSDPFDHIIGEEWNDVDNLYKAVVDVVVHRNFSLLCSRLELTHISATIPELSDSLGNYKFYAFESNMFSVPLEMVALKGFPFINEFSDKLELFKQLGVNKGIRDKFKSLTLIRRAELMRSLESSESELKPLSLGHLQGGFYALFLGYLSGILVFFVEICINSYLFKKNIVILLSQYRK